MKPNWIFFSMLLVIGPLDGLGLDLGLGVDPSYKPCWDHIICGVCYVWRNWLYVKGVRPRPLTCGKGGELKRIKHKLRVFDPGCLLVVRVGNLNELSTSSGCSTQAAYLW